MQVPSHILARSICSSRSLPHQPSPLAPSSLKLNGPLSAVTRLLLETCNTRLPAAAVGPVERPPHALLTKHSESTTEKAASHRQSAVSLSSVCLCSVASTTTSVPAVALRKHRARNPWMGTRTARSLWSSEKRAHASGEVSRTLCCTVKRYLSNHDAHRETVAATEREECDPSSSSSFSADTVQDGEVYKDPLGFLSTSEEASKAGISSSTAGELRRAAMSHLIPPPPSHNTADEAVNKTGAVTSSSSSLLDELLHRCEAHPVPVWVGKAKARRRDAHAVVGARADAAFAELSEASASTSVSTAQTGFTEVQKSPTNAPVHSLNVGYVPLLFRPEFIAQHQRALEKQQQQQQEEEEGRRLPPTLLRRDGNPRNEVDADVLVRSAYAAPSDASTALLEHDEDSAGVAPARDEAPVAVDEEGGTALFHDDGRGHTLVNDDGDAGDAFDIALYTPHDPPRSHRLVLDPVQWLALSSDAPLMDVELLRGSISEKAFRATFVETDAFEAAAEEGSSTVVAQHPMSAAPSRPRSLASSHAYREEHESRADLSTRAKDEEGEEEEEGPSQMEEVIEAQHRREPARTKVQNEELSLPSTSTSSVPLASSSAGSAPVSEQSEATAPPSLLSDEEEEGENALGTATPGSSSAGAVPALPKSTYAGVPESLGETDKLLFNVFTHRICKSSSRTVRALELLGIGVDPTSRQLRVMDTNALRGVASELRERRVSWPTRWKRGAVFAQLEYLLRQGTDESVADRVQELLCGQYRRLHRRQLPGVVVGSGGDAASLNQSDSDAASSSSGGGGNGGVDSMAERANARLLSLEDLNPEQQRVVKLVLEGYNTYIGGGAGTGKSVLLRVIRQQLVKQGLTVAMTATTGVAGCQIGGCTLHHCFGINLHGEFTRRKELASFDVIIIDEVSMLSREVFESLERHLRHANGVDLPFGGVQMILCGDFLQLGAIGAQLVLSSPLFRRHFAMLKLRTVVRQSANVEFAQQLQVLRRGRIPHGLQDTINFLTTEDVLVAKGKEKALKARQQAQLTALGLLPSPSAASFPSTSSLATTVGGSSPVNTADDGSVVESREENASTLSTPLVTAAASQPTPLSDDDDDTITFVDGAVNLLPTNRQVDETNARELARLQGEEMTFPPQVLSPYLVGDWSPTYLLRLVEPHKLSTQKLVLELEHFVSSFWKKESAQAGERGAASWTSLLITPHGHRTVVLYPLFTDALALRVRLPADLDESEQKRLIAHLGDLDNVLAKLDLGVRVREILQHGDGLHTEQDEFILEQYAARSAVAHPLRLKIGARVMLRTNLAPGLVNGSLGTVVGYRRLHVDELPPYIVGNAQREEAARMYADFLCYEQGFDTAMIPEIDFGGGRIEAIPPVVFHVGGWANTHHYSTGVIALPLSLAYAFTVHKVQGLTLVGRVHLELSRMWPCEHLLYVAMSRVRNPEQLSIANFHTGLVRAASDCLLFDDSLPDVEHVKVLPHFFQATWRRTPSRRKAVLRKKELERYQVKKKEKQRALYAGETAEERQNREIRAIQEALLRKRENASRQRS